MGCFDNTICITQKDRDKARVVDTLCRDGKLLLHMYECIGTSNVHPEICVATLTRGLNSFDTWAVVFLSACHLV